jgi:amino acid permease
MKFFKEFVLPVSLLSGTIIGAGIFSLPYVFLKAGIGLGFLSLILFGLIYVLIHLMYADVVIKNGNNHRFAGLAKIYFGKVGYWFSVIMTIVEMFFVLAIYLILSSSFVSLVFPNFPSFYQVIFFWIIGSVIIFSGTKRVAFLEYLALLAILFAVGIVVWIGLPKFFDKEMNFVSFEWAYWLLPFGPLLFSLSGRPSIPTLTHYFERNSLSYKSIKKSIVWGTVIPVLVYGLFVAGVIGMSDVITLDSISGIVRAIPLSYLVFFLGLLGAISLLSSYFAIGLDVLNSLRYDLYFSKIVSGLLVIFVPILIYFSNIGSFITLIEIAGGIFVSLEGILIVAMWNKERKNLIKEESALTPYVGKFTRGILYLVFLISIIYVLSQAIFRF